MDQIQIHPTVEANTAALITEGLRGDGAVLLNAEEMCIRDSTATEEPERQQTDLTVLRGRQVLLAEDNALNIRFWNSSLLSLIHIL